MFGLFHSHPENGLLCAFSLAQDIKLRLNIWGFMGVFLCRTDDSFPLSMFQLCFLNDILFCFSQCICYNSPPFKVCKLVSCLVFTQTHSSRPFSLQVKPLSDSLCMHKYNICILNPGIKVQLNVGQTLSSLFMGFNLCVFTVCYWHTRGKSAAGGQ